MSIVNKRPLTLDELTRAIFLWQVLVDNDYQYTLMDMVSQPYDGSEWEDSELWAYLWNIFKADGETLSQIIDAYFDEDGIEKNELLDDAIASEMIAEFDRIEREKHAQMLMDDAGEARLAPTDDEGVGDEWE